MSASRTITETADRLPPVHPGEILREDFLVGSEVSIDELIERTGIAAETMAQLLAGERPVDAEIDLRLGRYFSVSEGFFLRLQNRFDLDVAHRRAGDAVARIRPRVAAAA